MKKAAVTFLKFIAFFIGWAVCCGIISAEADSPVLWRFWAELIPLASIIAFSVLFWFIEKRSIIIAPIKNPVKSAALGAAAGILWLGAAAAILFVTGTISVAEKNSVELIGVWLISCLLNVIMQELLVRGYLYQLLKKEYSVLVSAVFTTALFTLCHGGALEAGVIPTLNVVTMSIFMTLALEYSQSILMPVMLHFAWNGIGAIILGGVSLADDYPSLLELTYSGSALMTGGECKIEGSVVVLILNLLFIGAFAWLIKRRRLGEKNL